MNLLITTDIILIVFIVALAFTSIILVLLVIYVLRLIEIRTKLKAKQIAKFNTFAKTNQIVFLGDSLTEFYQVEEFFHDFLIYNRGIASDTTDGVLDRLDTNVIEIKPTKVFLQIGTNDYKHHNNEYISSNIQKIVNRLKENLEDVKIYIISLYPVNTKAKYYSRFFTGKRRNNTIIELNKILKDYCEANKIPYIDVYSSLVDELGNLKKSFTIEGLHISYEGYEAITNILLPYVSE